MKYVKHNTFKAFFGKFFKPRIDKVISTEASMKDIMAAMWFIKKEIDDIFKEFDTAEMIQEGESLGSVQIPNVGKLAETKQLAISKRDAEELLKELGL